jgi:hypothetical protein
VLDYAILESQRRNRLTFRDPRSNLPVTVASLAAL